jgi:hypothetical protein
VVSAPDCHSLTHKKLNIIKLTWLLVNDIWFWFPVIELFKKVGLCGIGLIGVMELVVLDLSFFGGIF